MKPDKGDSPNPADGNAVLAIAFNDIELGVIATDDQGKILYANAKAARLLNIPHERLVAANLRLLRRERFSHLFAQYFEKARSTGELAKFEEMSPPPANVLRLRYSLYPCVSGVVITIEDVSAEWRSGEGLRAAALSINKLPDAIFFVQEAGYIFHSNETARRMSGYIREELTHMSIQEILPGLDLNTLRDREKEKDGFNIEMKLRSKRVKSLPVEVYVNRRSFFNRAQYIVTARDISERKQAERDIREARARAELYLDLMGHDINNMHQIALGYLELTRDIAEEEGNCPMELLDKPIEVMQRSAQLIDNVRKLQKLQDGVFQNQAVDVRKVLADVRSEFGSVPDKPIRLSLDGHDQCHVMANELLHDVFANLVGNAIKHTGDRADIAVGMDIVAEDGGRYCRVTVADDGPGIPDHFKGQIFNRMLKGDAKAKGMGLGLYLVKSLVDSYGGRVWVEDRVPGEPARGAKFVVLLPLAAEPREAAPGRTTSGNP